jgi:hypothetical protein
MVVHHGTWFVGLGFHFLALLSSLDTTIRIDSYRKNAIFNVTKEKSQGLL